jgi:hypothetical protein
LEEKGTEGAPAVVMKSEVAGIACSREREREERKREGRDRRKKGRALVQVWATRTNRTGVTESRRLLWHDWWTSGTRWLDHQSRQSRWHDLGLRGARSSTGHAPAYPAVLVHMERLLYKLRQLDWHDSKGPDLEKTFGWTHFSNFD